MTTATLIYTFISGAVCGGVLTVGAGTYIKSASESARLRALRGERR